MTDNRTTERVDHPPRVREAIDELMREKDAADNRTTELLRKLLDERGVEYEAYRDIKNRCITKWRTYHGAFVFFAVEEEGKLFVETASDTEHSAICTPEQAIEATLGNGTCENISDPPEGFYCSSCGWGDFAEPSHLLTTAKFTDNECGPNYCPNCGKAVKR